MVFRPAFYTRLTLHRASLLVRFGGDQASVLASDAWMPWRLWGGLLNGAAAVLFMANAVRSMRLEAATARPLSS